MEYCICKCSSLDLSPEQPQKPEKPQKSQKQQKPEKPQKSQKPRIETTKKVTSNFPIDWKDIAQLAQDRSSRLRLIVKLLDGSTHPTLAFGFSCTTSALGFSISSCRNQIHFHVFDDIMSLKHLFRRWKALKHIFFTWEGNIWRIAKGSTMVKGLIHSQKKQSNPLVTQITAIFVALLPTTLVASFGFMAGPSVSAARGSSTFACSNHAICWKQKQK